MSPPPHLLPRTPANFARCALFVCLCGVVTMRGADSPQEAPSPAGDPAIPQSLKETAFEALMTNSPFTRSLGVSDSLILTGIARVENDVFATLLDTKTTESYVVSKTANPQGWQLVGVGGNAVELHTLTAKIQIAGGQVISVRYQKPPPKSVRATASGASRGNSAPLTSTQLQEAKQAAVNYREGFSSDGFSREPPPEVVQKLSRLSVGQREDINRQMLGLRNRGLGMEERRTIYVNMIDRASQGGR